MATQTLRDRVLKSGSIKIASTLSESKYFNNKEFIKTNLPILNIALSGDPEGGLTSGFSVISGMSKSFKTLLALYMLKAYMDKHPDSICLFYDSEFGAPPAYFSFFKLDTNRIIHIPILHVEELKFDLVKRLGSLSRGDKVFIFLDSLGALPSKKEVDDAIDEKSVADMTRAKAIRSCLRVVVPYLTVLDIPFIAINHVYQTLEMFAKTVIPGGQQVTLAANTIFVITKAQVKDLNTGEITGWTYTINVDKSRFVREKTKFPFTVGYKSGISKYSGLFEIAQEAGIIIPGEKKGKHLLVDPVTGEIGEPFKVKATNTKEFWNPILTSKKFKDFVVDRYQLANEAMEDEDEYPVDEHEDETDE
ncbi:MAG: recombinase RecA [Legionella sp.]|uniref:hypothetical protein n=1 Tax=Legionella sp. TaxID=459 RepID=UPI0028415394|nr:recombinase RecA [Legionella sp.]